MQSIRLPDMRGKTCAAFPLQIIAPGGGVDSAGGVCWAIPPERPGEPTALCAEVTASTDLQASGSDPARLERIRKPRCRRSSPSCSTRRRPTPSCSALEVFPPDNPWNLVVEDWPVHPNSKNIIESIGANKEFRHNTDMGYILVPPDQKKVDVKIVGYPDESDKGPYPGAGQHADRRLAGQYHASQEALTLDEVQRDKLKEDGDRHAMVVDPTKRMLYEFYQMQEDRQGLDRRPGAAIFDLKSNKLRPDGWTSADAAGLPIFPATVRYDEIKRGMVEHAMRVTVVKTRRAYVYPATHYASKDDRRKPAAHGRALSAAEGFRHQRLLAGGAGDPEGPEEVRHVRRRQRPRLGHLGRGRSRASRCCTKSSARSRVRRFEVIRRL